ncbi:MAG: hypothetical protein F4046_09375, partial [Acidimicrobiaceae bacterium]|nr:hypothetical protein [Acidimicrobiaceae bacterium]
RTSAFQADDAGSIPVARSSARQTNKNVPMIEIAARTLGRVEVCRPGATARLSLMARGIYGDASNRSEAVAEPQSEQASG